MAVVELKKVSKIYTLGNNKIYALNEVSLSIQKGDFITIIGPSGSGKTTLLNMIGCLDLPTAGNVLIDGIDISREDDNGLTRIRRDKIGFIFQQFNLIPTLTALENVELPMLFKNKKVSKSQQRKNALALFDLVSLEKKYADHKPNELSGGQQQRVAIARALANHPPIILADEPTGNLDTKTGIGIMDLLQQLNKDGATVIVVTHNPSLAKYSSETIRIMDGKIGV